MNIPINSTTPVIIASAAVSQKVELPEQLPGAMDAAGLMIEAARQAADTLGGEQMLSQLDSIAVCQGIWGFNNPAAIIKQAFNADKASTTFAKIGVLQQELISNACLDIQAGKKSFCLVAGGEAKYRDLMASIKQVALPARNEQSAPDYLIEPEQELWLSAETDAGLGMPVGYYALMDSAYQSHYGLEVQQHRKATGLMYQRFSEIAAQNPDAWKRQIVSADDIQQPSDKNPMLAFPYTKKHNSSWNVDQAAAIIICSTETAQSLGVDPENWTFPVAATASNHMLAVAERSHLGSCPGAEEAAHALYGLSQLEPHQLDLIELYSCFPVGVLSFAKAMQLDDRSDLTTTGAMPFAGGPLNNYVLQATVKTLETLRIQKKQHAVVTNISGMNTKQGLFLYSRDYQAFQYQDVSEQTARKQIRKPLNPTFSGEATIVASTVLFQKNQAERVVLIAEDKQGIRSVAYSQESTLMDAFQQRTYIGSNVNIHQGKFLLEA